MDVTPPTAVDPPARPHGMALMARRAAIALAGLGVVALAGVACVLSFEDLRLVAVRGQARADLAYLYPAGFCALLAVALISVLLLLGGRWPVRAQAGAVLVLLLAIAVTVEVSGALGALPSGRQAAVIVAAAPWVMLAIALWLWLLMIGYVRSRQPVAESPGEPERDIVPFDTPERRPEPEPLPERAPDMELRWGDVIRDKPARRKPEDVLVHPRPATPPAHLSERVETWSASGTPEATEGEKGEDTQPMRVSASERAHAPGDAEGENAAVESADSAEYHDPAHGAEMADPDEASVEPADEVVPAAESSPAEPPPSGRMRSTPLPPEE